MLIDAGYRKTIDCARQTRSEANSPAAKSSGIVHDHSMPFTFKSRVLLAAALLLLFAMAVNAIAHPGSGIVVDRRGYVYFLDTGSGVWVVQTDGKLVRRGGPRFHWMAIDESEHPFGARLPFIAGGEITALRTNPTLL